MCAPRACSWARLRTKRRAEKSSIAKPTESNTVTCCWLLRPTFWPFSTCHSSVTAKSAGICCTSPSTRDCGSYSTNTLAARSTSAWISVLPGQSPPTAFRCMPGSIISGVMMVASALSAVTVVMMSAPRTASAVLAQTTSFKAAASGLAFRLLSSLAVASGSVSNKRISSMPSKW